jgi:hypothetical protein
VSWLILEPRVDRPSLSQSLMQTGRSALRGVPCQRFQDGRCMAGSPRSVPSFAFQAAGRRAPFFSTRLRKSRS